VLPEQMDCADDGPAMSALQASTAIDPNFQIAFIVLLLLCTLPACSIRAV